jgi:NADH:ubiquinone oxidoreductase subunit E
MNPIDIQICTGPVCYTEGTRLFKELGQTLSAARKEKVRLTGTRCRGLCARNGCPLAPCAEVSGELIAQATAGDILQAVRRRINSVRTTA